MRVIIIKFLLIFTNALPTPKFFVAITNNLPFWIIKYSNSPSPTLKVKS